MLEKKARASTQDIFVFLHAFVLIFLHAQALAIACACHRAWMSERELQILQARPLLHRSHAALVKVESLLKGSIEPACPLAQPKKT